MNTKEMWSEWSIAKKTYYTAESQITVSYWKKLYLKLDMNHKLAKTSSLTSLTDIRAELAHRQLYKWSTVVLNGEEKLERDEVPGGGCIRHSACRRKQIIQKHDAQTHKTGINGVSLVFSLQVTAQERVAHSSESAQIKTLVSIHTPPRTHHPHTHRGHVVKMSTWETQRRYHRAKYISTVSCI